MYVITRKRERQRREFRRDGINVRYQYIDTAIKSWRNIAVATAEWRHSRQLIQRDNGTVELLTTRRAAMRSRDPD